jgi:hypothetical protein
MVDIKGLIQVTPTEKLTRENAKTIGIVGVPSSSEGRPLVWVVSDDYLKSMEAEKRNLIKAKVRAIIGTAVFGAAFALALGALIGVTGRRLAKQ